MKVLVALLCAYFLIAGNPTSAGFLDFDSGCGNNKTHNFTFGLRGYYDWILYSNHTVVEGSFMRRHTVELELPGKGAPVRGIITAVEVRDQKKDGTGGCAYLKSGGVGHHNVSLVFKSQRGQGIDFNVFVYGHK